MEMSLSDNEVLFQQEPSQSAASAAVLTSCAITETLACFAFCTAAWSQGLAPSTTHGEHFANFVVKPPSFNGI